LNVVVESALKLLKHRIRKSIGNLSFLPGENIPVFSGNRLQIEQVVINLVLNAIEALEDSDANVTIQTQYDGSSNSAVLRVTDDGVGIPEELMGKLMTPFFTTKTESGGIGIGLSISDAFVRAHGARLGFVSKPGQGTTALLEFPLEEKSKHKKGRGE